MPAFNVAGLTTLDARFSYAIETTSGTKPDAFTVLQRATSIGDISLSTEQVELSAIEDAIKRYGAGQQDSGGTIDVTFNVSNEVITQLSTLFSSSKTAKDSDKATWFQLSHTSLDQAWFFTAECPRAIPMPSTETNAAWQIAVSLIISDYKGLDTKITPTM